MFDLLGAIKKLLSGDKEAIPIPRSVQQAVPIRQVWPDGIFKIGNRFSKCWRFSDINYTVASVEDKTAMFLDYSAFLNSLDSNGETKLSVINRKLNKVDFEKTILLPAVEDDLQRFRDEYNAMLVDKALTGNNNIVQDRIITITVQKKNVGEARAYFARMGAEIATHMKRLSSTVYELDLKERLQTLHSFFRIGEEADFRFDLKETVRKGHDFRDYLCPDSMSFEKDYFTMGGKYGRVLFLKEYANYIKDDMLTELCDLNQNLILSTNVEPVQTDKAIKDTQNRLLGVQTNIANFQRKQNQNQNFTAEIPYELELQRSEVKEFLDDLMTRDQRMFMCVVTLVHVADSKEQLDADTDNLTSIARKHLCQLGVLNWQQLDGLNTVLPYGLNRIAARRTLTTESLAVLMPFNTQELMHAGGTFYGQNTVSKNLIVIDRKGELLNGNGVVCGVSGSGKSFLTKLDILPKALQRKRKIDLLIIDPEREYGSLVKSMGGEVIRIAADSPHHINALDINADYSEDNNPLILKSEFVLSLCEQLIGTGRLTAKEKSLIDRCTTKVYRTYVNNGFTGTVPTLKRFHAELLKQPEPEAKEIALALELFTDGSLNTFAQKTNVDVDNNIICYDIFDLGKQLKTVGMLVVLDSILNRITRNRKQGIETYVYIDEFYLFFQKSGDKDNSAEAYSANFLFQLWKRVRKLNCCCLGITQNIEDCLQSHTARTMLANSEFLVMLNQAPTDRRELAKLLSISDAQLSYISNAEEGRGLIKCGGSIVPFESVFPRDTELYRLMTTKPDEMMIG